MIKVLPIQLNTYSNIYLEPAIFNAVIMTKKNANGWFLNNFIKQYLRVYQEGDLIYRNGYLKVYDETTKMENYLLHLSIAKLPVSIFDSEDLISYIIDYIKASQYVVLDFNEYYIDRTYFHNRINYARKFLIHGYDDERQVLYGYSHDATTKFVSFELPFQEVNKYIYQRDSSRNRVVNKYRNAGLSISVSDNPLESVSPQYIISQLCTLDMEYTIVQKDVNEQLLYTDYYGPCIYDKIIEAMELLKKNIVTLDFRAIQMLALNKKGISTRIRYLTKNYTDFQEITHLEGCYQQLYEKLNRTMLMFLKPYRYKFAAKHGMIKDCIDSLIECKKLEISYIYEFKRLITRWII